MHKPYSLLRNNKQSGPYSLEELLLLNLKPFDLVWVEGKSGGWSYPTEIDALKQHVEEAPEKEEKKVVAEKKDDFVATEKKITSTHPISSADEPVRAKKTASAPPKKANYIYIKLPAGIKVSETSNAPMTSVEESPEEKLERKAQALREKIQAFTESKNQPKIDNELDTKYARSLDDIKEEYTSWLHNQKQKKKFISKKSLLVISCIAFLFFGGYFILIQFQNKKITPEAIMSAQKIKVSPPIFEKTNKMKIVSKPKETNKKTLPQSSQKIKVSKSSSLPSKNYTPTNSPDKIDSYIDSLKVAGETQQSKDAIIYELTASQPDGSRQKTMREANKSTAENSKNETTATPFAELIKLSESTSSGTPHLSLYNNSNKHINFVAIDVFYYKANKKLLQKKTLYFNNISPLSSSKLFVPRDKKAASMSYQMGLISTEGGLYYAKQ